MSRAKKYVALDIGAESGRAIIGHFDGSRIELEEVYRFPNEPAFILGTLYWNVLELFENIKKALRACAKKYPGDIAGIGIDTWSLDFGLLAGDGTLISNPVHYRDGRTVGIPERVEERISREKLFEITGAPQYSIGTVYQLYSMKLRKSPILENAATFLMMPDILNYFLTGRQFSEETNAGMTQLLDIRSRIWAKEVFDALELPLHIMPEINKPATPLGGLLEDVAGEVGLGEAPVIAVASHDTASAASAVPGSGGDFAFISSGTWSVVCAPMDRPVTTPEALAEGFANEITLESLFFAKNLLGLWLVQELKRKWQKQDQSWNYDRLTEAARSAPPFSACIDPNDARFLAPADMEKEIADYCKETNQSAPDEPGRTVRTALESLAFSYRQAFDGIKRILGKKISALNIVGGGTQNALLCQFTANVCGVPVICGPIEATASGNVLIQALALGDIGNSQDIRSIVGNSFELATYEPQEVDVWEERYQGYLKVTGES